MKHQLFNFVVRLAYLSMFCRKISVVAIYAILSYLTFTPITQAAPEGGNIVGGSGSINQSSLTTTINQNTSSLAIDWNSFNINSDEVVNFIQPSSSSIALNRILSSSGSQIHGQINANGQVVLVNPNGIFFGATSSVNVGGLIASGLDISPTDFMNGDYIFNEVIGTDGTVINSGLINASLGGNVTLLGKQVINEGVINAKLGAVNLAAGKEAVLTFDNQGLIGVRITKEILQEELGVDPAVLNSGEINANGGRVLLTASVSRDVFSEAVNHGDLQQASSVVVHEDGSFTLGGGADVVNSGMINVSAEANNDAGQVVILGENVMHTGSIHADTESGLAGIVELHSMDTTELRDDALISAQATVSGSGGQIKILGENVGLFDAAEVNASGIHGGGEVLVGGDRQGLNSLVRNAEFLYLGENSNIFADAITDGNGGRIITYADDTGRFYGGLYARGGAFGGNGGFIETSGKKGFEIPVAPDVSAVAGEGGLWLIDPYDITINNANTDTGFVTTGTTVYTSSGIPATIDVGTIESALGMGSVEIITGGTIGDGNGNGDILFDANLNFDGTGTNTLTLNAVGGIAFTNTSSIQDIDNLNDTLNVNLYANGGINLNNATIDTQGGNFTVGDLSGTNSTPTSFTNNGTINTSGIDSTDDTIAGGDAGNISITVNGAVISTALTAIGGLNDPTNNQGESLIGANGGNITINADSVALSGAINTSGSAARFDNNDGTGGASGGNGGVILITANTGDITTTDIISDGGDADGDGNEPGNGGNAGDITLISQGGLGSITVSGSISSSVGAIAGSGTDGTKSNITLDGNVTLANALDLDVNSFTSGAIDASGAFGFNGSDLTIVSTNGITISSITTQGGDVTNAGGKDGGAIDLTGSSISVGAISTTGSDGNGNNKNGGSGGDILLTAIENSAIQSITIDGDLNSSGGQGTDGTGVLNGVQNTGGSIGLVLDDSGSPGGSVTINHATDFTSDVVVTGSSGNDTFTAANRVNIWSLSDPISTLNTNLSFSGIDNLVGNSQVDEFTINSGASFSGSIDGGGGTNKLTKVDGINSWTITSANSGTLTGTGGFSNIQEFGGGTGTGTGTGTDTLTGLNQDNSWDITGNNSGSVENTNTQTDTVAFTGMENLNGNSGIDSFVFQATGNVTGLIDTAGGDDSVDLTLLSSAVTVELRDAANANLHILNAETISANIAFINTLIGANANNNWDINSQNAGVVNGAINFSGFTNLTGGALDDAFVISGANGQLTGGVIDGGGGTDSITGRNTANIWNLNTTDGGILSYGATLTLTTLSNIENFTGGADTDNFTLSGTGSTISGAISGNGGNDTLTVSVVGNHNWEITGGDTGTVNDIGGGFIDIDNLVGNSEVDTFTLSGGTLSGNMNGLTDADILNADVGPNNWLITGVDDGVVEGVGSFTDIENLNGNSGDDNFTLSGGTVSGAINGGAGSNTLQAENVANSWSITSSDAGTVTGVASFSNIQTLVGGTLSDAFVFNAGGSVSGLVSGNSGVDSLNIIALPDTTVQIGSTINGNLNILGFESITANNAMANTLLSDDSVNDWQITGANTGTLNSMSFTGFKRLVGNAQVDTFAFQDGWSVDNGIDALGGVDIADGSALTGAVVFQLGAVGLDNFETFIGNNTNSTLIAEGIANTWDITGNNSGTVGAITFTDFNHLTGGDQVDIFNISGSGLLSGVASGGSGDDIANITLTGTQNGSFTFDGGGNNDTVNLIGGHASYQGQYNTDVPVFGTDQFSYTQGGNTYSVNYTGVETVSDDLIAASLTVNGTTLVDTIELDASQFNVNGFTSVAYTGKNELIIDGLAGSDNINLVGNVNQSGGNLTLIGETIDSGGFQIAANTLTLENVTTLVGTVDTDISQLNLINVVDNVVIDEADEITIEQIDNLSGSLTLTNATGNILDGTAIVAIANLDMTALGGDILFDNANQLGGELSLSASGDITFNNTIDTLFGVVDAQNLTITSGGTITQTGAFTVGNLTTLTASGQNIDLSMTTNDLNQLTIVSASSALIDNGANNLSLNSLVVDNNLALSARSVSDNNGDSLNISSSLLTMRTVSGIGTGPSPLDTQVSTMDVINSGGGNIRFIQTGSVEFVALQNALSTGTIDFVSDSDLNFNPGSVVANRDTGTLFMTTTGGSFLGVGAFDLTNADITANTATFIGLSGSFGTPIRPIILDVPQTGSVLIDTQTVSAGFFPETPTDLITTGIDISVLGAVSAIAGEQLIEIESLGDIDPAIFTGLRRYSHEDIAIRMPRDQLYEDELEEGEEDQL